MITSFLFSFMAGAEVDLIRGAAIEQATDLTLRSGLAISRIYHSRSLGIGLFGFGWCSPVETKVILKGGTPTLKVCTGEAQGKFQRTADGFIRQLSENSVQIFDKNGVLLAWVESGIRHDFHYEDGNKLAKISVERQPVLSFQYGPTGKLRRIRGKNLSDVKYDFVEENLVHVTSSQSERIYDYDPLHNLIRVEEPGQTLRSLIYDTEGDRLLKSFEANCQESYVYETLDLGRQKLTRARQTIKCQDMPDLNLNHQFYFQRTASGLKLTQVRLQNAGEVYDLMINREGNYETSAIRTGTDNSAAGADTRGAIR